MPPEYSAPFRAISRSPFPRKENTPRKVLATYTDAGG